MNIRIKVILFTLLASSMYSNAQLQQGSLWLGGSISYGSSFNKVKEVPEPQAKTKGISFIPYIGISIKENSIIGLLLAYSGSRQKYTGPSGYANNKYDYGAGVFVRKYRSLGKGFYLFANAELNYIYTTIDNTRSIDPPDLEKSKINTIRLYAYPGISYAINKSIHFEMQVLNLVAVDFRDEHKHSEFPVNNKRDEHERSFSVSTAFNENFGPLYFGFRFLLNRKKLASGSN